MDLIRYCLGMRFSTLGSYLVLRLYYRVTEILGLNVAISNEPGPINVVADVCICVFVNHVGSLATWMLGSLRLQNSRTLLQTTSKHVCCRLLLTYDSRSRQ